MEEQIRRMIKEYKDYERDTIKKMDVLYEKRKVLIKRARELEEKACSLNEELQRKKKDFVKKIRERNNRKKGINPIHIKFKQERWCSLGGYYLLVDKLDEVKEF